MINNTSSLEKKQLDVDLWIIGIITFLVFGLYAINSSALTHYVKESSHPMLLRLLLSVALQFGLAGLGISMVCLYRKESFMSFGLTKKHLITSVSGALICCVPYITYIAASGQFDGYNPLSIWITPDILKSGPPLNVIGMLPIAIVWGFFEGFNYVVIAAKINKRYPSHTWWIDFGALTCSFMCILFHPISTSLLGILDMLTTIIMIYGMLLIKKKTGNAWGCVAVFLFVWNAL